MRVLCFTGNRKSIRWMAAGVALTGGLLLGRSLFAQEAPNAPIAQPATTAQTSRGETFGGLNYLNGYSFLKGPIAPYKTREVPTPNLSNSPRMDQLVRDGKIYLSMSDAVALEIVNIAAFPAMQRQRVPRVVLYQIFALEPHDFFERHSGRGHLRLGR